MKISQAILITHLTLISITSFAGSVGSLSWDNTSNFITSSENDVKYLEFGLTAGKTFDEVNQLINDRFIGYRIANKTDAIFFANQLVSVESFFDVTGPQLELSTWSDGVFGSNSSSNTDWAYFMDGSSKGVGRFVGQTSGVIRLEFDWLLPISADTAASTYNYGWLVVNSVNQISAVPEPKSYVMFLLGLGLLGFVSRRNSQNN